MRARNVRASAIVLALALSSVRCGLTHDVDSLSSLPAETVDASAGADAEADAAQEPSPPEDVQGEPPVDPDSGSCGDLGMACCEPGATCGAGLTCDQGKCSCGKENQPCCGGLCESMQNCLQDTCKPCGRLGETCCTAYPACNTDEARCCTPTTDGHCGNIPDGICKVCCAYCSNGKHSPGLSAASTNYDCDETAQKWCKDQYNVGYDVDKSGWWDGC
ncbi:MAG: hypothetical protein HY898_18885 [Deltaproteobacteria bacterium]|nr:hypothetical protein [Deltaproteobacteria bacterium]